jgi:phosphate transport system permease protein
MINKIAVLQAEKCHLTPDKSIAANLRKRRLKNKIFHILFMACTFFGVAFLILLMSQILSTGLKGLSWKFITSFPSRKASEAGILPAILGSLWLVATTALISVPLGVGTAIYLEEYVNKSRLYKILQINIANLAGIPSIIYGLLGLSVFVKILNMHRSILAGALTLSLLVLPIIIIATQEAIKAVPDTLRQGSLALGVSRWQTITGVVLPYALPGILTGSILAISRALGEAAPLIMVGAAGFINFLPKNLMSSFTALPIQIFNWTSRPQQEFQDIASSGIIVLMVVLLTTNSIAIIIRNKYQKRFE